MLGLFKGRKPREKPLLLHVDDDAEIREIVALALRKLELDVVLAPDGQSGIDTARRDHPDLILLDIRMPGLDGFDVCHRLKTDSKTKDIPIIMVTAMGQGKDVEKAIAHGADAYIQKPIDYAKLRAKIGSFVKIAPPPSA